MMYWDTLMDDSTFTLDEVLDHIQELVEEERRKGIKSKQSPPPTRCSSPERNGSVYVFSPRSVQERELNLQFLKRRKFIME